MYTQDEITHAYGAYHYPDSITESILQEYIQEIDVFPSELSTFYNKLDSLHQEACYRDGSWNFRQVIHHIADSHMQAFTRFKLALTENEPIIKPYIQNAWADTEDSLNTDAKWSLQIIPALHERWIHLLKTMSLTDFNKTYFHPDQNKSFTLAYAAGLYAWHGKHHLGQMERYASNQGWVKK